MTDQQLILLLFDLIGDSRDRAYLIGALRSLGVSEDHAAVLVDRVLGRDVLAYTCAA